MIAPMRAWTDAGTSPADYNPTRKRNLDECRSIAGARFRWR